MQGPAALYFSPHVCTHANAPLTLVYMHVESAWHLVASSEPQAILQIEPNSVHPEVAWHCVCDGIWLQSVTQAPSVGLNIHPCVAAQELLVLLYLHKVPHVPLFALYWHTSDCARHADWVVRLTQAVTHEPVTGFVWQREPADWQPCTLVPNASVHDWVQEPATIWQALSEAQVVADVVEQSVLHCWLLAFHPHSGLLLHEVESVLLPQDTWHVLLANWHAPLAAQSSRDVTSVQLMAQRPLVGSHVHSTSCMQDADVAYRAEHFCWQVVPDTWQVGSLRHVAVERMAQEATHFALVAE